MPKRSPQSGPAPVSDVVRVLARALEAAAQDGRLISFSQDKDTDGNDVVTIVLRPSPTSH